MHKRVKFLTIPDTLLPYLKTWDKSFKDPKNPSDYVLVENSCYESKNDPGNNCIEVRPKQIRFIGKEFLITDARNGSTTFTLARLFKTYHCGKIIGEPTSGNQQGINGGQFFFLYLPYSNIEVDIPLVWGAYTGKRPDTGIEPDFLVPETVSSLRINQDVATSFVQALVEEGN